MGGKGNDALEHRKKIMLSAFTNQKWWNQNQAAEQYARVAFHTTRHIEKHF